MASFRVEWLRSAKKDVRKLRQSEIPKILSATSSLADNPFPAGCKKLAGSEHNFRIRVGDYRVIYEVFESVRIVEIQQVGHRKDIYRK